MISLNLFFFSLAIKIVSCDPSFFKLKKCCDKNEIFNMVTKKCEDIDNFPEYSLQSFLPDNYIDTDQIELIIPIDEDKVKVLDRGLPKCPNEYLRPFIMGDEGGFFLFSDGSLVSLSGPFEFDVDLGDFCLDIGTSNGTQFDRIAVVCDPCARSDVLCIKTCCPAVQGLANENLTCEEIPNILDPPTWKVDIISNRTIRHSKDYFLVYDPEFTSCPKNGKTPSGFFSFEKPDSYRLFGNGSLELNYFNESNVQPPGSYCVYFTELSQDEKHYVSETFRVCPQDDKDCLACTLYPICCTISNIFLIATFIIYCILPELRKPLFGKLIMTFVVALFLAYLSINAFGAFLPHTNFGMCVVTGFLTQFFFLTAFFWMNILAFDMFKKFTKPESRHQNNLTEEKDRKKLIFYTIYGIGCPLIITAITVVLDVDGLVSEESIFRPYIGYRKCFFDEDKQFAQFLLYHLPLLLIQLANMVFFGLTVHKLRMTWKATQGIRKNQEKAQQPAIIIRVFLIMGINWLFEFLSFLSGWLWDKDISRNLSYLTDVINMLQGVLIFVVLVCKESVLNNLKDLLKKVKSGSSASSVGTASTS